MVTIEKCMSCDRYDTEKQKMKNKLRCMFACDEYQQELHNRAVQYNRAVSGEDFDNNAIYEHGKYVVGSGLGKEI